MKEQVEVFLNSILEKFQNGAQQSSLELVCCSWMVSLNDTKPYKSQNYGLCISKTLQHTQSLLTSQNPESRGFPAQPVCHSLNSATCWTGFWMSVPNSAARDLGASLRQPRPRSSARSAQQPSPFAPVAAGCNIPWYGRLDLRLPTGLELHLHIFQDCVQIDAERIWWQRGLE